MTYCTTGTGSKPRASSNRPKSLPRARVLCLAPWAIVLWILPVPAGAAVQQPVAPAHAASCSCADVLEQYVAWVEGNHIGYVMEVLQGDPSPYERRKSNYRRRARRTPLPECVHLVNDWLGYFGDPHLAAVRQRPDSLLAARGVPLSLGMRSVPALTARVRRPDRDPVEGVWRSGSRQLIVAEDPTLRGVFVVTVAKADSSLGPYGAVIARLERDTERGIYRVSGARPFADATRASLHRDAILHLGRTTWARDVPRRSATNPVHPTDPLHPTLRVLDDETVLVTLPSHLPQYRAALDSLIVAHRDALSRAPILLIDVRGNQGGSGDTARPLAPFYFSPELWADPPRNEPGWIMASPYTKGLYRYLRRVMGGDEADAWIRATVDTLETAETGALVRDRFDLVEPFRPDSVNASTRFVGIVTDWINMSAVDAFLLEATASDRVIVFGEATESAIDYQNAWAVAIDEPAVCGGEGFLVVYPRNASSWMPEAPINPTGLIPDVPFDEATDDWVRAAHEYLRARLGAPTAA